MSLVEAHLGNWEKAQENLSRALDYKTEAKFNIIDKALNSILVSCDTLIIVNILNLFIFMIAHFI